MAASLLATNTLHVPGFAGSAAQVEGQLARGQDLLQSLCVLWVESQQADW